MTTIYPAEIDSDLELPRVDDNIVEIGADAINAVRSAIFAIEETLGLTPQGTTGSVEERISVALNADGSVKPSALASIGLINLPITNSQISPTAGIQESKLLLTYTTQFLYDLFADLDSAVNILNGFVSTIGVQILPHNSGAGYRHELSHIDVDAGTLNRVDIESGTTGTRDLDNAYTLVAEISNDLLAHTRADKLDNDTTPPENQAHNAAGIYINPTNFVSVPQTANDLQTFADYVDSSSLVLLGSRTQNLFSNGIPRTSRSNSLVNTQAGEAIVDPTPATTYLLYGSATSPVDDIDHGDDVIFLNPPAPVLSANTFDAQFSQVKSGDYITINYGNDTVPVRFTVDSAKKYLNGSSRIYTIRIHGKNLYASNEAVIRIDRPFYHDSKFHALALAAANNTFSELPSLIIGNPAGAATLGIGFNPAKLNNEHYNLYLNLYPTGNPVEKTIAMPAIDVTGDEGISVGSYTLNSIVENINDKFREPGFNCRFIAFAYQGEIGISLADRYNDASFSIIAGTVDANGAYTASSNNDYLYNIIDNYNNMDPLGFGANGSGSASPAFSTSYSAPLSALVSPTVIFAPLRKNFFYVDGVEKDSFSQEVFTTKDGYGDGYWLATLKTREALSGHVEVTYEIELDLSTSGLKKGKTLVIQPAFDVDSGSYNKVDYGRFIIKNIVFNSCPGPSSTTTITVYDAIHATGSSPITSSLNIPVFVYFSDDSVSFNIEHVSDPSVNTNFKRFFEVYVDPNGDSFTHERARFSTTGGNVVVDSINSFTLYNSSEISAIDLVDVSPKLRGHVFGQYRKITLYINSYNEDTGIFSGYLSKFEHPSTYTRLGPTTIGKKGEIVRFYDDTLVDYIDITITLNTSLSSFVNKKIDIQLYSSLQLNQEKKLIGTCQLQDSTKQVAHLKDKRQFGNTSEKNFTTSAISFINAPQRLLDENGVIRGFDTVSVTDNKISIKGGIALVDGTLIDFNDTVLIVPDVQEVISPAFTTEIETIRWYLCINNKGDFEFIASTDYELTASGYGSLDHNRLFYVKNPSVSSDAYPIRATYFSKLVSEFKDLLPLYVISGDAPFEEEVILTDVRRFVEKGYNGLASPFTLGRFASFRSIEALHTYIGELTGYISYYTDQINTFGQTVYVRDNFDISDVNFSTNTIVRYVGDGGKFIVSSNEATISKNTEFTNMIFDVSNDYGFKISGNNVKFDNCTIAYEFDATADGSFNTAQMGNVAKACIWGISDTFTNGQIKNISITNCNFTTSFANHYPFIGLLISEQNNYAENIIIERNRFDYTTAGDDKRAVVVVTAYTTTTPSSQIGPRLVNSQISNNICNKNQLILMSGEISADKIINMLVPVNVKVSNNICGAICFLVRQDRSYNIANTTAINDKDDLLIISGNTCRYIYCGSNRAFINDIGSSNRIIYDIITANNIYSASVIIKENATSWIHVGVKNPTTYGFETPTLEISSNRINAYVSSFLTAYHSVITPSNTGLIVDSVQGT